MEIVVDVSGYEGLYAISNSGRLYSHSRSCKGKILKGRWLKPSYNYGYQMVTLCKSGSKVNRTIHSLVAQHFILEVLDKTEVNHIDEDKDNNHYSNLEWCTKAENNIHSKAKSYKFLNPKLELIDIFNLNKFCKDNNLHNPSMYSLHKGTKKSYKGWTKF